MKDSPPRVFVYRGAVPLWLVLMVAPLGLVFLTSLLLAIAVAGTAAAVAALVLPRWWQRRAAPAADRRTIELDQSQYRHIDTRDRR
jgi:hypothetical protein